MSLLFHYRRLGEVLSKNILFIESRDPQFHKDVRQTFQLATDLATQNHLVNIFLIQNSVHAAHKNAQNTGIQKLFLHKNIQVFADDVSLQERGIDLQKVWPEVVLADSPKLVDLISQADTPIWH